MKNIFKKNHIIITALLIMIVIAGYLSFTNKDAAENKDMAALANPDADGYEEFTELDGYEVVTDTTGTDATGTDTTGTNTTGTDTTGTDTTGTDATTTDTTDENATTAEDTALEDTVTDTEATGEEAETTPVDTTDDDADLGMNEISDEDILETAHDVSDNGDLNLEEGVPGEAVLANAAIDSSYFISSKLDREQRRAKSKASLMDIIESNDASEASKDKAMEMMLELTEFGERETAAEIQLEGKGFSETVVYIVDDQVDVFINSETLSDQQLAMIEDVIVDKTGFEVAKIQIIPVVVAD